MSGSLARQPGLRLLVNGNIINGAERSEVTSNSYYQGDRFNAVVALNAQNDPPASWWSQQTDLRAEIQISLDGNAWQSMLIGNVDVLHMDVVKGFVAIDGRDLSSLLIDQKTQQTYANQTSSQIATALANEHGLTPVVTATTTLVGQYYQLEHDRLTLNNFHRQTTEWDLLTYLADLEGFDVFVQGNELHFQPQAGPNTQPMSLVYQPGPPPVMPVCSFDMSRSLTLAKDIEVTVKTWNSRHKSAYTKTVRGSAGAKGTPQQYVFVKPNMTPDQALAFAQQKLAELSKHERILRIEMPGELTLTPRSMIALSGTGTSFDQSYYVAEIERTITFSGGFMQRVRAKNTSPRTQTTVE